MILADTSVWVRHFRRTGTQLAAVLEAGEIVTHPFVIGELACGNLPRCADTLRWLDRLPALSAVSHTEALALLEARKLSGRGLGYVDVHLLAAVVLDGTARLWTLDRPLDAAARELGVAYTT